MTGSHDRCFYEAPLESKNCIFSSSIVLCTCGGFQTLITLTMFFAGVPEEEEEVVEGFACFLLEFAGDNFFG